MACMAVPGDYGPLSITRNPRLRVRWSLRATLALSNVQDCWEALEDHISP
jgi:hypothetical protein